MTKHRTFLFSTIIVSAALGACSPSGAGKSPGGGNGNGGFGNGGTDFGNGGDGNDNAGGNTGINLFNTGGGTVQLTDAQTCGGKAYKGKLLPSNILFVQDRSGSMNCNLPPETLSAACEANPVPVNKNDPTKWSVISSAMANAIDSLAKLPNTSVGLSFFSNDDLCGVQSTPSVPLGLLQPPQVSALKNAFTSVTPAGGTPIIGAVVLGYKYLHQVAEARGNRFVVLITDGEDSCLGHDDSGFPGYASEGVQGDVVNDLFANEIPKAYSVNIRTFVIGVPGSETDRGFLSRIAYEGHTGPAGCDGSGANPAPGAACHLDMTQTTDLSKDLSAALQNITGTAALTCQFDVPTGDGGQKVDTSTLNVDYFKGGKTDSADDVPLVHDESCAADNAWKYVDSTQTQITLCKNVCTEVLQDNSAQVDVEVGCVQRVPS